MELWHRLLPLEALIFYALEALLFFDFCDYFKLLPVLTDLFLSTVLANLMTGKQLSFPIEGILYETVDSNW